jgi:hypothetical protein
MSDTELYLMFVLGGVCSFPVWIVAASWRGERMLQKWAARNGFEILKKESTHLSVPGGPITKYARMGRPVYRVSLSDKSGAIRRAWVICGHWYWGVISSQVKVVWILFGDVNRFSSDENW